MLSIKALYDILVSGPCPASVISCQGLAPVVCETCWYAHSHFTHNQWTIASMQSALCGCKLHHTSSSDSEQGFHFILMPHGTRYRYLSLVLVLVCRIQSWQSCSAVSYGTTSESIKFERLDCCRTTVSWRRRTFLSRSRCLCWDRTRWDKQGQTY